MGVIYILISVFSLLSIAGLIYCLTDSLPMKTQKELHLTNT